MVDKINVCRVNIRPVVIFHLLWRKSYLVVCRKNTGLDARREEDNESNKDIEMIAQL